MTVLPCWFDTSLTPNVRIKRAARPSRFSRNETFFGIKAEVVGASGFEPPTSRSRTVRSTKLSHAPIALMLHAERQ